MKVLLINKFYYVRGGTERYCFDLAELLQRKGHKVIPFSMAHEKNLECEYAPYFVDEISLDRSNDLRRPLATLRAAARAIYSYQAQRNLKMLISETRPDVAYLHNIHHQISLSILPVLKRQRIPIVWRLHDYALFCPNSLFYSQGAVCEACGGGHYYQIVLRACRRGSRGASLVACLGSYLDRWLRLADQVDLFIAPSHFLRAKMIKHGLEADRVVVQPNFVDVHPFAPAPPRPARRLGQGEGYWLYAGRLSKEKGVETLIRAVAQVPEVRLKIAGDGPQRAELQAQARERGEGRITFAGHLSPDGVREVLQAARAIVVPSEWYENCPYTILEAFAAGKPVIASNIGGIPELVRDGWDGLLFKAGDADDLAERIRLLASDLCKSEELGSHARQKVEQDLAAEAHYRGFLEICSSFW
jgi:glycosyltransferase involved in cell wall biosynthesis